jgi:hypothetical protein
VTDLYNENYKSQNREINEAIRRWKDITWISRINVVKMSILPKATYNRYQNSNNILHQDRKVNLKVHMEAQKTLNSQSNPEPKEQCWRYHNT